MEEVKFHVNPDTCIHCGLCASDCVCEIIEIDDLPRISPENWQKCLHCGHCQAVCPTASISLDEVAPETLEAVQPLIPEAPMANLIRSRRSVRHFISETINADLLERIIHLASWAPTAKNAREVGYVVINGRQKVEGLIEATTAILEKHGFLPEVLDRLNKGQDVLFRGAPCVLICHAPAWPLAAVDCGTALATLELMLPVFGLASCWAGYLTLACGHEIPEGIPVPAGNRIYGALMLGNPAVSYKRITYRTMPDVSWV